MNGDFMAKTSDYNASKNKSHENIESQQISNKVLVFKSFLLNEIRMY